MKKTLIVFILCNIMLVLTAMTCDDPVEYRKVIFENQSNDTIMTLSESGIPFTSEKAAEKAQRAAEKRQREQERAAEKARQAEEKRRKEQERAEQKQWDRDVKNINAKDLGEAFKEELKKVKF